MLLTSSQASIAVSSLIVVAFTSALFLSGYVIQQRTLRDLREAIKPPPRPSPQIYLQTVFEGGGGDGNGKDAPSDYRDVASPQAQAQAQSQDQVQQKQKPIVIQVAHSDPENASNDSASGNGRQRPSAETKEESDDELASEPIADDSDSVDLGRQPAEKPLSRVERRKRIKDEIRRLSQGETPLYYQRRLW